MNGYGTANALGVASSAFLALAVVLAVVAVILYFVLRIRDVRNELTGKTAERAIAQMRSTTWAERRMRESSARKLTDVASGDDGKEKSFEVRSTTPKSETSTTVMGDEPPSEAGTTLLEDAESETTLLSDPSPEGSESATTLLGDDSEKERR